MFKENVYHDKNKKKQYFAGVLISKNDSVLLGMKKRGFGSGLWNHSFAGKVEAGEEIASAARRELEEESGLKVDIDNLIKVGYFEFEFTDSSINPRIMAMTIYRALDWAGDAVESSEMCPAWCHVSEVPYPDMWPDNRYWLDMVLSGKKVKAYFLYNGFDNIARHSLEVVESLA